MRKTLFAILVLSIFTSTVFAGYNADMAYKRGQNFATMWENNISPTLDNTIKSKSNWDMCVYLLQSWKSNNSYIEKFRNSAGYDRDWVQGCQYGMSYQYGRKGR